MERNLLCKYKRSDIPYYVESIHLNLYALEEMCYFLSTNIPLAFKCIKDAKLLAWLDKECHCRETTEMIREAARNGEDAGACLMIFFRTSHYFTNRELEIMRSRIGQFMKMPPTEQQKIYGDALMDHGKYHAAISVYESVLGMPGITKQIPAFAGSVFHNMGCAYAMMLQMDKAREYFFRAYERCHTDELMRSYLKAVYIDGDVENLKKAAEAVGADKIMISDIVTQANDILPADMPEDKDGAVREWMRRYHYSIDA